MKRLICLFLTGAILLTSSPVFASTYVTSDNKVVDATVVTEKTFFIDSNKTLYCTNVGGSIDKVLTDVKAVYECQYDLSSVILILKADGTLLFATENEDIKIDDATGLATKVFVWEYKELYKGVKDVVTNYLDKEMYVLKTDGSVILVSDIDVFFGGLVEGEVVKPNETTLPKKAKDIAMIKGNNLYYIDEKDVLYNQANVKQMENVLDIESYISGEMVLTKNGKLYHKPVGGSYTVIAESVKDIESGTGSFFAIKKDNRLYGMGYNNFGKVGVPNNKEAVKELTFIDENVADVSSYNEATVYVTSDGKVKALGDVYEIGLGENSSLGFSDNLYKVSDDVKDMALADSYSMIIKEDDSLYVMGQLVRGDEDEKYEQYTKISDNVKGVSANKDRFSYVTKDGKLYYRELLVDEKPKFIAKDVKESSGKYFLTNNGDVYEIMSSASTVKIKSDVKHIYDSGDMLCAISKDDKLFIKEFDSGKFYETKLTNVKDVKCDGTIDYYVLDNYGVLKKYTANVFNDFTAREDLFSYQSDVAGNVVDFAPTLFDVYYTLYDSKLYSLNFVNEKDFEYVGVKKIEGSDYGNSVLILMKDNTLYSSGYNGFGELGYDSGDKSLAFEPVYISVLKKNK